MDRNASADALLEALPYSKEAEQSVLGAVIADPARITDVLEYLKPESFYGSYNREIFSVLMRMFLASEKIDVVTLLDKVLSELKAQGRNLNQLTTLAHMGKITVVYGDRLAENYGQVSEQLRQLLRR